MRYIRKLIYRMGFQPKPGSIFYSPSMDIGLKIDAAVRRVVYGDQRKNGRY